MGTAGRGRGIDPIGRVPAVADRGLTATDILRYAIPAATSWALSTLGGHLAPHPSPAPTEPPSGWVRAGSPAADYAVGVDHGTAHTGHASGFVRSARARPAGAGALMQVLDAGEHRGRRLRLSAWVRTRKVRGRAGVWMRVDGAEPGRVLAADDMSSRPITGTSEWTRYEVVLDVAPEAATIAFGLLLEGPGRAWIDDVALEDVDASVPLTGGPVAPPSRASPDNPGFER